MPAPDAGIRQNTVHSHSYAGITRIRFEGQRRLYAASQPACASTPWICEASIALPRPFVKPRKGKAAGRSRRRMDSGGGMWYTEEKERQKEAAMPNCFIFAAGDPPAQLPCRPGEGDLVIAADAGYRTCLRLGLTPDLLIGDFDSMEEPADFAHILRVPVEKDDTDTFLAAKTGLSRGCTVFHLYGGSGGERLDHTLANLQMLLWLRDHGAWGYLYDRQFTYTAIQNEEIVIPRQKTWALLSVFCLGEDARGVTETGVQYPLQDAVLTAHFPLGVSNHILAEEARVRVEKGALLLCWER